MSSQLSGTSATNRFLQKHEYSETLVRSKLCTRDQGIPTDMDSRQILLSDVEASTRFRLQTAKVVGFRSFRQEVVVNFSNSGLTCITGPNGAGKSTLLNAILFGLGESAMRLGAKQNAELASAANAVVELVFHKTSHTSLIKVSSTVSQTTGQRTFSFNGQKLPKHRFDHLLRSQLGIVTGNPFWRVSQDGIQQLLHASPQALHDSMCEVSGTKVINSHRLNALRQLSKWKRSLVDIKGNLTALEEAVGWDGAQLRAMDRAREISVEIEAIPKQAACLDHEITLVELRAARSSMSRLATEMKNLETTKGKIERHARVLEAEAIGLRRLESAGPAEEDGSEALQNKLLSLSSSLAQASMELEIEKTCLREKEQFEALSKATLRNAEAEKMGREAKLRMLRERSVALRERRARLEEEVRKFRERLLTDDGGITDPKGALEAAQQALESSKVFLSRHEARRAVIAINASRAEVDAAGRRSEAAIAKVAFEEVCERLKEVASQMGTGGEGEDLRAAVEGQRHSQRALQRELLRELQEVRQSQAAARRRVGAQEWCSDLRVSKAIDENEEARDGHHHHGFLFELFDVREDEAGGHLQALASLLAGSLTVWVCEARRDADQALDLAKAHGAGLRVWPMETLRNATLKHHRQHAQGSQQARTRVAQALEWAERRWPHQNKVVNPRSLLKWDRDHGAIDAAMEKALGGWVIAETDGISSLLLAELKQSSVTRSGVRHAPGEVIAGETVGEEAKLRAKLEWDRAQRSFTDKSRALEACTERCRDLTQRLESEEELARLQSRRGTLEEELDECTHRLSDAETVLELARRKLSWADEERERIHGESMALSKVLAERTASAATPDVAQILPATAEVLRCREEELENVRQACTQIDDEMSSLAEESMEAMEREKQARETLGILDNPVGEDGTGRDPDSHHGEGQRPQDSPVLAGGGEAGDSVTPPSDLRLTTLRELVESKTARVVQLESLRDALTEKLTRAIAREETAHKRLTLLEQEIARASDDLRQTEGQISACKGSLEKAKRRIRQASNKVVTEHRGDVGGDPAEDSSSTACSGKNPRDLEEKGLGPEERSDVPAMSDTELVKKKHELAAKEKLLTSELRKLQSSFHGQRHRDSPITAGIEGRVDEVTLRQRQNKLCVLRQQLQSVEEATRQLEAGILACEGRMHETNEACYTVVRRELQALFGALCANKSADIVFTGEKLEDGLRLVVKNRGRPRAGSPSAGDSAEPGRSPQELSGGQQALLGLALVLALSSYQAPPLCLLDEVDAALDESNQAAAARLLATAFRDGQVLCVSHHAGFHRQSSLCIPVEMRNGVSRLQGQS